MLPCGDVYMHHVAQVYVLVCICVRVRARVSACVCKVSLVG